MNPRGLLHVMAGHPWRVPGLGQGPKRRTSPAGGCRVPRLAWDLFGVPLTQTRNPPHSPAGVKAPSPRTGPRHEPRAQPRTRPRSRAGRRSVRPAGRGHESWTTTPARSASSRSPAGRPARTAARRARSGPGDCGCNSAGKAGTSTPNPNTPHPSDDDGRGPGRRARRGSAGALDPPPPGRPRPAPATGRGPHGRPGVHHPGRQDVPALDVRSPSPCRPTGGSPPRASPSTRHATTTGAPRCDALHFPKLVDRFWQNLRRCAGYQVQYFATIEPQRRLAPHLHAAIRGHDPPRGSSARSAPPPTTRSGGPPTTSPSTSSGCPCGPTRSAATSTRPPGPRCPPGTRRSTPSTPTPTPSRRTWCGSGTRTTSKACSRHRRRPSRAIGYLCKYLTKDIAATYDDDTTSPRPGRRTSTGSPRKSAGCRARRPARTGCATASSPTAPGPGWCPASASTRRTTGPTSASAAAACSCPASGPARPSPTTAPTGPPSSGPRSRKPGSTPTTTTNSPSPAPTVAGPGSCSAATAWTSAPTPPPSPEQITTRQRWRRRVRGGQGRRRGAGRARATGGGVMFGSWQHSEGEGQWRPVETNGRGPAVAAAGGSRPGARHRALRPCSS